MQVSRWTVLLALIGACSAFAEDKQEEEYYTSFNGYSVPIGLTGRRSKEEAMRHESYLVAWRDDHGRLKRVVKMLKGKVFFSDDYTYDGKGVLVEVRLIGVDGKTKVLRRTGGGTYE